MKAIFGFMVVCLLLMLCSVAMAAPSTAKRLSPDHTVQIIAVGSQLPQLISEQDSIYQARRALIQAYVDNHSKVFEAWVADPNGPLKKHEQVLRDIRIPCPEGKALSPEERAKCNAMLEAYNAEDLRIAAVVNEKIADFNQVIEEKKQVLYPPINEKKKLVALRESIAICLDGDVMNMRACMDTLYDSAVTVAVNHHLDMNVVQPGPFGTKYPSAAMAIQAYRISTMTKLKTVR